MNQDREALVHYRLERAKETLAEAELLAKAGHWNGCVNRLYYACFYAVTAALLHAGFASSKHSGVMSLFNRHLVKPGIVSRDSGQLYSDLFRSRQRGDYEDLVVFDEARVRPWVEGSRHLIAEAEFAIALERVMNRSQ